MRAIPKSKIPTTLQPVAAALLLGTIGIACGQDSPDYELRPVSYSATEPHDALAKLRQRIATGELAFAGNEKQALRTLLDALGVPVESQLLVFSKTSLQRGRIRPEQPRALYFSDSVYVGWVPGGLMEVTAIDPQLGPVFYSVELAPARSQPPKIERDSDCLRCHGGTFVRDIPGLFARSLYTAASGEPMLRQGTLLVDDETPFEQRWGGWYVTGYRGKAAHRGNVCSSEQGEQLVFNPTQRRPEDAAAFFNTANYLKGTSDVVALLVFQHQLAMHNSITAAGFTARKMLAYQHELQTALNEPVTDEPAYDSVKSVYASVVQDVVDHLLFRRAAPLPEGVVGNPEFKQTFTQGAPRSKAGDALKDLQLHERLLAQRCSFLIYSESFRSLPATLKLRILDRLRVVLRSRDPQDRYAYLPGEEKQRIFDILIETHPDAKRCWAEAGGAAQPVPTEEQRVGAAPAGNP